MQAFITLYSKSKHSDPSNPNAGLDPDADNWAATVAFRDEVGLIRTITVKERSSAKRKQLFKDIQAR
ncbi:hypothetical protein WOLCODRAFT_150557 [Wolfiporia cocos MD-104 SS10]|uniref:Uncharacterized protein n=1 Tax=Wolfiporia cocos (strain MD-104) TaxID=742152 RepID=A0A2H3JUV3_WOLCO|nr:hypothetical protein WOLCODRAFT_150557 [Wolfiporia cocos MD-104 SS10]